MVPHVEMFHAFTHRGNHFGIAVSEAIGAAVDVDVDQAAAVHVKEVVTLAAVDYEVDAGALPLERLAGIPVLNGTGDEVVLSLAHRVVSSCMVPQPSRLRAIAMPDLTGSTAKLTGSAAPGL